MVVYGGQMQCGPAVLAALLDVDDVPVPAHDLERLDAIQLSGQMHRRQFLLVQHARFDAQRQQTLERIQGVVLDRLVQRRIAGHVLDVQICDRIELLFIQQQKQ